jgi:hypothetical protein
MGFSRDVEMKTINLGGWAKVRELLILWSFRSKKYFYNL